MGQPKRPLVFERTPEGCFVCTSHKPNQDGYFRFLVAGRQRMFHRVVLELRGIPIPEGHEVDHRCKNRQCCNPAHLQVLPRLDHLVLTNKERYAPIEQAAQAHWLATRCTGTELASRFDRTVSASCRWIRRWKSEGC